MSEVAGEITPKVPLAPEVIKAAPFRMPRTPANFSIILGYHTEPEDISDATAELVQDADVVLLESVAWTSEDLRKIRGIVRTGEFGRDIPPYFQRLYDVISGTKASYHFWDPPLDTQTSNDLRNYYGHSDLRAAWTEVASLEEYRKKLDMKCENTIARDTLALKDLGKKVDSLVGSGKKPPKKPISVVIMAGAMHQLLGHRIEFAQDNSHRARVTKPQFDDGPTKYIYAKLAGETVDDETLKRMLLLDIFIQHNDGPVERQIEEVNQHIDNTSQDILDQYIVDYFATIQEKREALAKKQAERKPSMYGGLANIALQELIRLNSRQS